MNKKKQTILDSLTRAALQLFFFFLMPGTFSAGFSGIKNIFLHISTGSVLELNDLVKTMIALILFTIIFGRFFCGYACAFGTLGDFVFRISGLIQKKILHREKQVRIPEQALPLLQKLKYLILALVLTFCGVGVYGNLEKTGWNPWTVFSLLHSGHFHLNEYVPGTVLLLMIIAGMAFQERFFCQILCPLGALFALLPQIPFAWFRRDPETCIKGCRACKRQCPVGIRLETDGFRNGECIDCGRCAEICPAGNLNRWDRKLFKNKWIPVLIKAAILFALGARLGLLRVG